MITVYNNVGAAGFSVAAPTTAAVLPVDFPLGLESQPLWLVLGGFAVFAALQAAKRIAPTWHELVGDDGHARSAAA